MSVTVITYDRAMGRWEPNTRSRLEEAALELFVGRGYDKTTAAQIAQQAGLTERTFFRYFADKREVLFAGSALLQEILVRTVVHAPPFTSPIDAVAGAFEAAAAVFDERRDRVLRRQTVIAANPELQERELIKLATLAGAMAGALRERGVGELAARLAAETGAAAFHIAFARWVAEPGESDLRALIGESFSELKALVAGEWTSPVS